MIRTKKELREVLKIEKDLYFQHGEFQQKLVHSKNATIYLYQSFLRKEEYYLNNGSSLMSKVMLLYYKRRKNKLGQKLGFDIPANCFDVGLRIYHVSPVTINSDTRIGKYCSIYGNNCIGQSNSGVPTVGDFCTLGYGAIIIGGVHIVDKCVIGAGSVVTKSVDVIGSKIAGIPAKVVQR
ncbi:serine O-acetyltransferase [Enterococcus faecium]|uniref:serine O-acetyltransferase n=1 Tax=Enterococcus faecium TaxID=1352 RepID=UPI0018839A32|nr:serine acetyltransferase [Enterococcus faecium]EME5381312.1 hypothetical protein [Enterococcus faecium]MBE9871852.1 serine acetyltransferase [Enterococcus faecium]MDK4437927.1 hypothetical protein [Enterococcus faecium]HBL8370097.1 hypothetical protein [Enterococcus faecium]